ncbi:MAG: RNA methyltransferase substrate-binding domain-containing protein [Terracidiphilus sp.]|jgi:tRNA G18 (ribose-2'-O)-methylase SpoU
MEVLYGLHPVEEAVKAGRRRFDHVLVARERRDSRLERLVAFVRTRRFEALRVPGWRACVDEPNHLV